MLVNIQLDTENDDWQDVRACVFAPRLAVAIWDFAQYLREQDRNVVHPTEEVTDKVEEIRSEYLDCFSDFID